MMSYIEYLVKCLNVPAKMILFFVIVFFAMQAIGETIEFFGKVAPGFMKVRKRMAAKRQEEIELRETIREATAALKRNEELFRDVQAHYSEDNIAKRDQWMQAVNSDIAESKEHWRELSIKLDRNNADTLAIKIENMRTAILSLAQRAIDPSIPLTHEEFRRVFRIHKEYQQIIEDENLENGEVDIAITVIEEGYKERLKHHSFIEDTRGYAQNV